MFERRRATAGVAVPSRAELVALFRSVPVPTKLPTDTDLRHLAGQWGQLLGRDPETIRGSDDFFALGGNAELAAVLLDRVEEHFGPRVDEEQLQANPTLEGLAAVVKSDARLTFGKNREAVLINRGDPEAVPVFFLSAMGATILGWRRVGAHLHPRLPLYAMESTGFDAADRPLYDLEEIAAYRVQSVRAAVGGSPVVLCGHSFGGDVAYEIARQLEEDGHEVAGLVLLDTASRLGLGREPMTLPRLRVVARRAARRKWKRIRARVVVPARHRGILKSRSVSDRVTWIVEAERLANNRKRHRTYHGTLTLLTVESVSSARDPWLGWRPLVESIDVRRIPGTHRGLLTDDWVESTAAALDKCLSELTAVEVSVAPRSQEPSPPGGRP